MRIKIIQDQIQRELVRRKSEDLSMSLRAFTEEEVELIRQSFLDGVGVGALAEGHKVCKQTVQKVLQGKHPYTYDEEPRCLTFEQ